ncbi:MAG: hypothetical protein ABSB15_09755 [Bryobacteraceae bacterium]|jgi:hypothetical protein
MRILRTIASVILGYVAIGVLVFGTDQIFAAVVPGFKSLAILPLYYYAISLITDSVYSLFGGWLCARLAPARPMLHAITLIVCGEVIGIGTQVMLWNTVPHWFGLSLVVLFAPAVWIGAKLVKSSGAAIAQSA